MTKLLIFICFNFFYLLKTSLAQASTKSFPISTLLNAKFTVTPLQIEVALFLSEENANLYWEFIDGLSKLSPTIDQLPNEEQQYKKSVVIASKSISKTQMGLLKLSLALRSLTPLIQAHLQIANEIKLNECAEQNTFVQINTIIICDINKIASTIQIAKDQPDTLELYEFDQIFPGSQNNTVTSVLYGQLGAETFNRYHRKLKSLAEKGVVRYVIRTYVPKSDKKVRLSGYGVELHLKSTEYKSQDDSPRQADEPVSYEGEDAAEMEIEGIQN